MCSWSSVAVRVSSTMLVDLSSVGEGSSSGSGGLDEVTPHSSNSSSSSVSLSKLGSAEMTQVAAGICVGWATASY